MLVQNSKYPEFVADQLLTSDNLNDLFGYLDEQGRITRTNLIGIGIVCGLEVKTAADGSSITISKGTGVTSEGYMVTIAETTYTDYVDYDPLKEEYYDKLVNTASKTKRFDYTWELKQASVEASTKLNYSFLNGNGNAADKKVVLLFVEMLSIGNKNCNPNSCDDKGITIEITVRPLLVRKADIDSYNLATGASQSALNQNYIALDEKRIPRFDVVNTRTATTADVFNAYKKILSTDFLTKTEELLTSAWSVFSPVVGSEYNNVNPFQGLASAFAFINNSTMDSSKALFMQYYYDHFSDLLAAYDEFRITGMEVLSTCCPDSSLFPRHLLLDLAIKNTAINYSQYRHYFIYSPLFQQKDLATKLKLLFRRIVLIRTNFSIPAIGGANSNPDPYQRITPSRLDASPLSQKAIPYYYMVNNGANPLFKNWSFEKSYVNAADKNLSYHASAYSSKDFVVNALNFDLESYNFLRIEGHIGKGYSHVLRNLKKIIGDNRLPTDVIAICTDDNDYSASHASHNSKSLSRLAAMAREGLGDIQCYFKDLEAIYDSIKNETLCTLCKELRYYYEIPIGFSTKTLRTNNEAGMLASDEAQISEVTLFERCTKVPYKVKPNTFGVVIERIYSQVGNHGDVTLNEIFEALGIDFEADNDGDGKPDQEINSNIFIAIMLMMPILEIPIYIIRLSNYFTEDLHTFDVNGYCKMQEVISKKIVGYKSGASLVSNSQKAKIKDDLSYAEKEPQEAVREVKDSGTSNEEKSTAPETGDTTGSYRIQTNADALSVSNKLSTTGLNSLTSFQGGLGFILLYILLLEDLYDHLDVLNYSCKCRPLMGLKEEYLRRVAELAELRQLRNFSKRHPGLQHKAGVTMGGTFIILYHSPTAKKRIETIKKEDESLSYRYKEENPLSKKINEEDLDKAVQKILITLRAKKITLAEFNKLVSKTEYTAEEVVEIITQIDERLLKQITGLIIRKAVSHEDIIDEASDDIAEGIVIADFYLPYLCYSNCPPIVYQVAEIKDAPVDVKFSLQPDPKTNSNIYSVTDETEYVFMLSPTGGTITNGTEANGVLAKNGGFVFIPAKVKELLGSDPKIDFNFTYSVDGVTGNTVIATVYNIPTAKITISPDKMPQAVDTTFKIFSETQFADKFSWSIDGKNVSIAEHLGEQSFKESGTYTVSLSVLQSATGVSAKADDVIIEIAADPTITISSIPTITSPITVGSTVTFLSDVQNANEFSWRMNNAEISKEEKIVNFPFNSPGMFTIVCIATQNTTGKSQTSNSITVQVEAVPTATIVTQPSAIPPIISVSTSVVFNSSIQNGQVLEWRFEDGNGALKESKTSVNFGPILFNTPGTFKVKLTAIQPVTNWVVSAAPVTIQVAGLPTASIVTNPGTQQPVPLGGSVTFNGVVQNAEEYKWTLRNMSGAIVEERSTLNFGSFQFNSPGLYNMSLTVRQTATNKTADATPVSIYAVNIQKDLSATISLSPATTETYQQQGARLTFVSNTQNVDRYKWFQNNVLIPGETSSSLSNYAFNAAGSFSIRMVGENSTTGQTIDSNTIDITIQQSQQPTTPTNPTVPKDPSASCGSLAAVLDGFKMLQNSDKKNYPGFNDTVLDKMGVNDYFARLNEFVSAAVGVQIEFFEEDIFMGAAIDENIARWMTLLTDIITDDSQKSYHLLAAMLYRILLNLAMYIACIQKGDITKATMPMAQAMQIAKRQLEAILQILATRANRVKTEINAIPGDVNAELTRMQSNGTGQTKPVYKSALEAIVNLFA